MDEQTKPRTWKNLRKPRRRAALRAPARRCCDVGKGAVQQDAGRHTAALDVEHNLTRPTVGLAQAHDVLVVAKRDANVRAPLAQLAAVSGRKGGASRDRQVGSRRLIRPEKDNLFVTPPTQRCAYNDTPPCPPQE